MSTADCIKPKKQKSSVNCIFFGKYKSKHNKNKTARPVTNIAICSYVVESDSSDEDIPKDKGIGLKKVFKKNGVLNRIL